MSLSEIPPSASEETPASSLRRAIPLVAVLVGGVVFSAVVALVVRDQEHERFENEFDRQAQIQWRAMKGAVREYEECMHTLRDLFMASEDVTAAEFRRAAVDLRTRHSGLELLGWLRRVSRAERAAFEVGAVRADGARFFIHESSTAEPRAAPLPAPDRDEYLPFEYCEPVTGNEKLFGFDQLTGPYLPTITRAIESGGVSATKRVMLGEGYGAEPGWAFALPVSTGDSVPETVADRRARWRGIIVGAVPFSSLIKMTVSEMPAANIDFALLDESGASGERFLIGYIGGKPAMQGQESGADFRSGLHRMLPMPVAGRHWIALFRPNTEPALIYPWAFLASGFAITSALMALLYFAQQRTLTVQRLVRERTAELHATQRTLHEDNQRRRKAEERYRAFVEQSSEAISRMELSEPISVDLPEDEQIAQYYERAFFAEANDAFAQMYGFERAKEMIGMKLSEMMPRDHATFEHLRRYVRSGYRLSNAESKEVGRNGVRCIFLNNMTGIVENGRLVRAWGTQRDVTDQRAAEEEKEQIERRLQETQKLESLGILAGGVAHDFNNLLTGILGNTNIAQMDVPKTSPVQTNLAAIEKIARRAAELCKQMLAYSGKGRFVVQRLDLSEIVEDTAQLVRPSLSKDAELEFHLAENLPAIAGDATQMRQIIMNLVINASDALGEGPGIITLSTGVIPADAAYLADTWHSPNVPPGEYVFLEVTDTGCGMSDETLSKIFNPFFTTKFTGRGLGLAAVLGIVRGHGGTMKVSSEVGEGSTFRLLLPSMDGPVGQKPPEKPPEPEWRGAGSVLVADDDGAIRLVAARLLETFGYRVVLAADGIEALEIFRKSPAEYAVILLDLTMPKMDGIKAFTEIRRIRADIPIVLMSGYNEQDAATRFADGGPSAFVQKPFTPEELQHAFRGLAK